MKYEIRFTPKAEKELNKLSLKYKEQILIAVENLSDNPFIGKKLKGKFKEYYSIRVWSYRIIYTIYKQDLLIIVIRVGGRKDIYK